MWRDVKPAAAERALRRRDNADEISALRPLLAMTIRANPIPPPDSADSTSWLVAGVYEELRRLAYREMRGEGELPTLQPTALVHEAYLRLSAERTQGWANRAQFFHAAATAMRRILVDRARARAALRRDGGVRQPLASEPIDPATPSTVHELLELDAALEALRAVDGELFELVTLRYFAGLTIAEAAAVLERSPRSVRRDWETARLFLYERIQRLRAGGDVRAG